MDKKINRLNNRVDNIDQKLDLVLQILNKEDIRVKGLTWHLFYHGKRHETTAIDRLQNKISKEKMYHTIQKKNWLTKCLL